MCDNPDTANDDILKGLSGPSEVTPVTAAPPSPVARVVPAWTAEQLQCALVAKPEPVDQVASLGQLEQSVYECGSRKILALLTLLRGSSAILSADVLVKAYQEIETSQFHWMAVVLYHGESDRSDAWRDARQRLLDDGVSKARLGRLKSMAEARVTGAKADVQQEEEALRKQAAQDERAAWANDPAMQWLSKVVFVTRKGEDEPVWDCGKCGPYNALMAVSYEPLLASARLNIRSMEVECQAVTDWMVANGHGELATDSLTALTVYTYLRLRYSEVYGGKLSDMEKGYAGRKDSLKLNIDNPRVYDPILEWMRQFDESAPLTPEESVELDSFLYHATCGQVPRDAYHDVMSRKWWCGLFRTVVGDRGMFLDRPELMRDPANACPPDFMLVITDDGSGGCGKDHFLRELFGHAPSAYSLSENFEAKRSTEEDLKRLRYWCCVDSEFKGGRANRQDTADLKHTITKTTIDYRAFYTQETTKLPVRSVICATENTAECIRTDNTTRRYFIINVQAVQDVTLSDGTVMRTAFDIDWLHEHFDRYARLAVRAVRNGEACKLGSDTRELQTANIRQHYHQVSDDALDTLDKLVRLVADADYEILNHTAGQLDDLMDKAYGKSVGARVLGWRLKELVETGLLARVKGSSNRTLFATTDRFSEAVVECRAKTEAAQKDAQQRLQQAQGLAAPAPVPRIAQ